MSEEFDDIDVHLPDAAIPAQTTSIPWVFVTQRAYEVMDIHAQSELEREVGGVLIGTVAGTEEQPLVMVEFALAALHTDQSRSSVTFTHDTWTHINEVMDRDYPDKKIVGWYHTHPGFGLFLSEYDLFIHRNFFNLPWQVAIVLDPRALTSGLFIWQQGAVTGPHEVLVAKPATATSSGYPVSRPLRRKATWKQYACLGVAFILAIFLIKTFLYKKPPLDAPKAMPAPSMKAEPPDRKAAPPANLIDGKK